MNKESPKVSKRYSKYPDFGMIVVINGVMNDSNNRVVGKPRERRRENAVSNRQSSDKADKAKKQLERVNNQ